MTNILIDINDIFQNIGRINEAKEFIEDKWIKEKKIKEKLDIIPFLQQINMQDKIYVKDEDSIIPFNYFINGDKCYLFYCSINEKTNEIIDELIDLIDKMNNGKIRLIDVSNIELLENQVVHPDFPYFIMNQQTKVIKQIE